MSSVEELLTIRAAGEAIPQGSKKAWVSPKTGRAVMAEAGGVRHASWRREVTAAAEEALRGAGLTSPMTDPVTVSLTFFRLRGVGQYGSGRNALQLKPGAPEYPTKPPDLDKLVRSIFDSLTDARVWVDDSQVVSYTARKRFVDRFGDTPDGVLIVVGRHVA
jgi:Holliday junction resolvase RusA-like endonuclease